MRSRRGEGSELGEHAPKGEVVAVVDAADDHHVAAPDTELVPPTFDREQRARAGRVDGVCGAVEVESVGDARGGEVGHETDRGLGVLGPEAFLEVCPDLLQVASSRSGTQRAQRLDELGAPRTRWSRRATPGFR